MRKTEIPGSPAMTEDKNLCKWKSHFVAAHYFNRRKTIFPALHPSIIVTNLHTPGRSDIPDAILITLLG